MLEISSLKTKILTRIYDQEDGFFTKLCSKFIDPLEIHTFLTEQEKLSKIITHNHKSVSIDLWDDINRRIKQEKIRSAQPERNYYWKPALGGLLAAFILVYMFSFNRTKSRNDLMELEWVRTNGVVRVIPISHQRPGIVWVNRKPAAERYD